MPLENEVLITSILDEAKRKSFERFEAMGESARPRVDEQNLGEAILIVPARREDPEYDCLGLQGQLCELSDRCHMDKIINLFHQEHDSHAARRLQELHDPMISHA